MHSALRYHGRSKLVGILSLATLLVGGYWAVTRAEEPVQNQQPVAKVISVPPKLNKDELLKKYPLVSIAPRLEYERKRVEADKQPAKPKLSKETAKSLDAIDKQYDPKGPNASWYQVRTQSLKLLHSDQVDKFISRAGFGLSRMPQPSPYELNLPETEPLPFAKADSSSETSVERIVSLPKPETPLAEENPLRLLPLPMVREFYGIDTFNFASPNAFGYVKSRDAVAGFSSHKFQYRPDINYPLDKDGREIPETCKWLVRRLELVSLLKHDKPAVYLSEHLPRMEELKDAKTRELSKWEETSLAALRDGEDLQIEATPNHLTMLGAVRASKACLECHYVQRGALLGAFSYSIDRDPPVKVAPAEEKPLN